MRETQPHTVYNTKAAQKLIDARAAATADAQRRAAEADTWNRANARSSSRFTPGSINDIDSRVIQQQHRAAIAQPTAEPAIVIPVVDDRREYAAQVAFRRFHLYRLTLERKQAAEAFRVALGLPDTRTAIEALHSPQAKKRFGESE